MVIARQGDSIWSLGAMGEGRQDHPRSKTHDDAVTSARNYGRSLGEKHANEAWRNERRDDHGRWVASSEHEHERHHEEGRQTRGEQRDAFVEGYYNGFESHIARKKREEGEHKKSSARLRHEAIAIDPITGEIDYNDGLDAWDRKHMPPEDKEARFRHYLEHGTYEGWAPKTYMQKMDEARRPEQEFPQRGNVTVTDRNPAAPELDDLVHNAQNNHGITLSDRFPFSAQSYATLIGDNPAKKSKVRGKLPKGSLASDPMETIDSKGVKHTFWHQISTEWPVDNPKAGQPGEPPILYQTEYPGAKQSKNASPRVTVALHHYRSDTGLQPPMVSNHTLTSSSDDSTARLSDLQGMFRTNDQTRLLHQLGIQRVGDWNKEIKFEYRHPGGTNGDPARPIRYTIQRVNGDDSRYPNGGLYYDPDLRDKKLVGEDHPDYIGEQWAVTPHTVERVEPFNPRSEVRDVAHLPIMFSASDDHGFGQMLDHVLSGKDSPRLVPDYGRYPQVQEQNEGGLPPSQFNPKTGSISPWTPEHNIHRSRERLPIQWS